MPPTHDHVRGKVTQHQLSTLPGGITNKVFSPLPDARLRLSQLREMGRPEACLCVPCYRALARGTVRGAPLERMERAGRLTD